jgi:hypothetical protein
MLSPEELARRAQQLLDDAVVQEIFASLEGRYVTEWRHTSPADVQKRETAHASIRALDDFRSRLKSLATAPKVEAHNSRGAAKR